MSICAELHNIFNKSKRHYFPFDKEEIPDNGIYILFEKGESGHNADRIVRIGTHTGNNKLRARLKEHFIKENKDRSIFRKNIGRAILNKNNDPFLEQWNWDLTTRKNREKYSSRLDFEKQKEVESLVSEYIRNNCSFAVFEIGSKEDRLDLEAKLISTVSICDECKPSSGWLGLFSPKKKIRDSGLWLVNELWREPLDGEGLEMIRKAR